MNELRKLGTLFGLASALCFTAIVLGPVVSEPLRSNTLARSNQL